MHYHYFSKYIIYIKVFFSYFLHSLIFFIGLFGYLKGTSSFEDKLQIALKAFLCNKKMPTQQKEDLVVVWLMDLVKPSEVRISFNLNK